MSRQAAAPEPDPAPVAPLVRGVARSEHDWRVIAEAIPHIVFVARPDGSGEYLNKQGTDYTGLVLGPDYAWGWTKLIHPDDEAMAFEAWLAAVDSGTPFCLEYRIRRFDGRFRWHTVRARPVTGDAGEIVKWVGTTTDIDDQWRYQHALEEQRRKAATASTLLETLQDAAPVGFGFVDREFRYVRLNQELATMNGAPIDAHIGRTTAEMLPRMWDKLEAVHRHVLDTGEPVRNLPVSTDRGPGGVHDLLANYFPVRIDGEIVGVGLVVIEISAQVQAQDWLTVMDQVSDGVYAVDADGRLTYINRVACVMLGWSEDELLGKPIHDLIHFQNADGTPVAAAESPLRTEAHHGRVMGPGGEVFTRKDGSTFPVSYWAMPVRVKPTAQGVAVVFRDASDPTAVTSKIRVLISSRHKATTDGFRSLLNRQEGIEVVDTAATSAATVAGVQRHRPDVVLVDYDLPDFDGAVTTAIIKAKSPVTSVILITDTYSESVHVSGIASGCAGVVEKGRAWVELVDAVRAAYEGEASISQADLQRVLWTVRSSKRPSQGTDLTNREREVLACLKGGLSNAAAAERLGVTTNTIRNHVQRILYKLNVHSKLEAVVVATRDGLLDDL